jgi:hypothetical protein
VAVAIADSDPSLLDLDHSAADLDVDSAVLCADLGLQVHIVEPELAVQEQDPHWSRWPRSAFRPGR